jgi:hypothetical protein
MFLSTRPLWLAILLVVFATLLAMSAPVLIRRRVGLSRLRTNNEVAGFKFATVGVLYAVLLAFAVIVVWEKFNDAENAVAQEAGAAVTIYRLANGLGEPGTVVRIGLTSYIKSLVGDDWPAMEQGGASLASTHSLNGVYAAVLAYSPSNPRDVAVLAETLRQLDALTQARRARLVLAAGIVPEIVWLVLLGGAFLTIGFTLFFGTENLPAQAMMTGILSVLIFSGLLIIIVVDHPFAGTVRVRPEALIAVLDDFAVAPGHNSPGLQTGQAMPSTPRQ